MPADKAPMSNDFSGFFLKKMLEHYQERYILALV
jgi:hypothetical protein